ncbi:uncharacterized protein [Cicer arietinum]|uniref:Uncharacterized protein LOC105852572 n=1 Tax=Cicer arietinum TaxID=3827 RepID=A0A1S3EF70_CICAR|nr:uncharacterized protein LOC105852572 [Cicer arietinum]
MKDCSSLSAVHPSIGDLQNLLLINLKDCTSLNNLPKKIYQLKSLKTLILSGSGCSKIDKLEEDIVQMKSLTTLIAKDTGGNYPSWLAYTGEGSSARFQVPKDIDRRMKGIILCAIYSFNDEDWKNVISHLKTGDDVEIFVAFGHGFIVKETAVYLIYGESIAMEFEQSTIMEVEPSTNMEIEPLEEVMVQLGNVMIGKE